VTTVVISQPMYFPWVGMLEQIRLCDVFVHYDDAQFSKGSFSNRVQVKTATGPHWMSVPMRGLHLGQRINEVRLTDPDDWQASHLALLSQAYRRAPCAEEMLALVRAVFEAAPATLADLGMGGTEAMYRHLRLPERRFLRSSALGIGGGGGDRVLEIVRALSGTRYVTGHGAANYLDHDRFEKAGVEVRYMDYRKVPYPQQHGEFTPYVTALDLIANLGKGEGGAVVSSGTVHWREFVK
jgi:WbqC-like protein family